MEKYKIVKEIIVGLFGIFVAPWLDRQSIKVKS
jgi:hypothetical protein